MRSPILLCLALAGLVPAALPAQTEPAPAAPNRFGRMWTPWPGTSHDALQAELDERRRAAEEARAASEANAAPAEQEQRRIQAVALGERVGEIVRMGDCEEGERLARAAGDFPLVRAVRDHCRARAQPRA